MKIVTSYDRPPIPARDADWSAIDSDTYDGDPDSNCPIGRGATERDAINNLVEEMLDREERRFADETTGRAADLAAWERERDSLEATIAEQRRTVRDRTEYAGELEAPARELLFLFDWRPAIAEMEKDPEANPKTVARVLREYGERKKAGWIALRAALSIQSNAGGAISKSGAREGTDQPGATSGAAGTCTNSTRAIVEEIARAAIAEGQEEKVTRLLVRVRQLDKRLTAAVAVLDAITTPDGDLRLPTNEAQMARLEIAFAAAKETP